MDDKDKNQFIKDLKGISELGLDVMSSSVEEFAENSAHNPLAQGMIWSKAYHLEAKLEAVEKENSALLTIITCYKLNKKDYAEKLMNKFLEDFRRVQTKGGEG